MCSAWGSLQRPWRGGRVWRVCSSPDSPLCLRMRGWAPAPRRFPGSAQSCHVSPGRTQEEGGPLSPSGGPADSQGCHTAGPLCARTHQSCLDRLSLFFFSVSPTSSCPPCFPSKSLSQGFPSPLLPSPSCPNLGMSCSPPSTHSQPCLLISSSSTSGSGWWGQEPARSPGSRSL